MNGVHFRTLALALLATAATPAPSSPQDPRESAAVHGFVREAESGEPIPLSLISVDARQQALADGDGYFAFPRLRTGEHRITVRALGYAALDTVLSTSSAPVQLRLRRAPLEVAGITARASRALERPFETPEVSVRTVTPAEIRRVPAALEADLFRSIQALPGVVSPGILSSRLLVRGGAPDQNLFLLDGYPVIQPYHLGGGFSAFHTEAVRDAELWMGVPPARYGGALSSVLDVSLREGNRERTTGTATLGTMTSSAVIEGGHPLGAWFVGARRTYVDIAAQGGGADLPYHFHDAYLKSYADVSPADRLGVLLFLGRDAIYNPRKREREHFRWSNDLYGFSWRHLFGGRAVLEQRVSLSRFGQELRGGRTSIQGAGIATDHDVALFQARGDLRWNPTERHRVEIGYTAQREEREHRVVYTYGRDWDQAAQSSIQTSGNLLAGYVQDDVTLSERLRLRVGVRGEAVGPHQSLQPRVTAKYLISDHLALTGGAGTVRQYDHVLQDPDVNFDVYSVDVVRSSLEPDASSGRASHFVGGVEARLPHDLRLRAEGYAKTFDGLVLIAPYDPANRRFAIERLETASGTARGLDLSLGREEPGRVRGWVGYSLASSERSVEGSTFATELLPRQRFVAVWDTQLRRDWGFTGRFEAFEGIPYTPATTMVPWRDFDFNAGHFSDLCDSRDAATKIEYLYGARGSARTGWTKRLDLGAGRRWTSRRGWKWELSLSLLNVLFDPLGTLRPVSSGKQVGCVPEEVRWENHLVLPPIPSVGVRVEF
ncbi:MAG: TonB-dependent receptor [Gemmatimonadota bacterium]|nr:TonB-dependent receptor [Gemmatimonadota bacterium]